MKTTSFLIICVLIFIFQTFALGQESRKLKFTDDSELEVTTGFFNQKVDSVKISEKSVIADFTGDQIGKAGKFSDGIIKLTRKRNKILSNKIKVITTAYSLVQGENSFYINGFNSIDFEKIRKCEKCRLKCRLIIFEVISEDKKYYVPVIKTIEKL